MNTTTPAATALDATTEVRALERSARHTCVSGRKALAASARKGVSLYRLVSAPTEYERWESVSAEAARAAIAVNPYDVIAFFERR